MEMTSPRLQSPTGIYICRKISRLLPLIDFNGKTSRNRSLTLVQTAVNLLEISQEMIEVVSTTIIPVRVEESRGGGNAIELVSKHRLLLLTFVSKGPSTATKQIISNHVVNMQHTAAQEMRASCSRYLHWSSSGKSSSADNLLAGLGCFL